MHLSKSLYIWICLKTFVARRCQIKVPSQLKVTENIVTSTQLYTLLITGRTNYKKKNLNTALKILLLLAFGCMLTATQGCLRKMLLFRRRRTTLLISTHNMRSQRHFFRFQLCILRCVCQFCSWVDSWIDHWAKLWLILCCCISLVFFVFADF